MLPRVPASPSVSFKVTEGDNPMRSHLLVSENLECSLEDIVDRLLAHVRFPLSIVRASDPSRLPGVYELPLSLPFCAED